MRNFKYIIIVAIGFLFAMTSCSDGEERDRTLEVETLSLTLDKKAQTKKIMVTADKGNNFTATWDGDNWGGVSAVNVVDGFIEITTKINTTKTPRKTSIIVALEGGLRNRVINITQNGDDPLLSVIPEEIKCDFMEKEIKIEVSSDVEWGASSEVEWLKISLYKKSGAIIVEIEENLIPRARSTTITITAGASSKEVLILQDAAPLLLIPYLNAMDATFDKIVEFEEARHNSMMRATSMYASHNALTRSRLMPVISYTIKEARIDFVSIEIKKKYMPDFFGDGSTIRGKGYEFLLERGYEHLFSAELSDYFWINLGDGATYHYLAEVYGERGYLNFEATKTEKKPNLPNLPTFSDFPHMPDDIAMGSNKDVAKTWEAANGGELNNETDKLLDYNVVSGAPLQYKRYYSYSSGGLGLLDVTYVFKEDQTTKIFRYLPGNNITLNQKFVEMLTNEGFVAKGTDEGYILFEHGTREILIKPYIVTVGTSTTQHAAIAFRPRPTGTGVSPQFTTPLSPLKAVDVKITR